ncbi:serine hydrolase domain-containing protein [Pseudoxanthomonas sp.]|uniref:serine hydrolase domain-containing protein n=1 Tax=Pseudoxanthomonas sp. TaxID=1871049 RepID=UPI002FDF6DC6
MIPRHGACLRALLVLSAVLMPSLAAVAAKPTTDTHAWLQANVVDAGYPGARMIVLHDGKVVRDEALGFADIARTRPLRGDAIYRIYSMTKPVVSAAVLRLIGEGHGALDDPIGKHLPELAGLKVMGVSGIARAPVQVPTIRHLLTHTTGFPIAEGKAMRRRIEARLEYSLDLATYVQRVSKVPLAFEPGTQRGYDSINTEVLGRLVEVWSGRSLPLYLHTEFFVPLGMVDTGFEVPVDKRDRIVELSRIDDDGRLVLSDEPTARYPGTRPHPYFSAAGGLYSTASDYLAFARMLLAHGRMGERQFVPAALMEDMFREQLAPMGLERPWIDEIPGRGFGLGLSVLLDPAAQGRSGAAGQVGWTGAASTAFVIDPATQSIGILLLQHLPNDKPGDLPRVAKAFYNHVQQVVAP